MISKEDNLKNIFECAYLFLLIDQLEGCLWGKSIQPEIKKRYSNTEREIKSEKSIAVTFHALNAIYTFTKDPNNPAIQGTLSCLSKYRDNSGGYGIATAPSKTFPKVNYGVVLNCKSTTSALLIDLLFESKINIKFAESIKFLIAHSKEDGGWGTSSDVKKEDSECVTTSYVLKLLTLVRKKGIKKYLLEESSNELDNAIEKGLNWLERTNEENGGFWIFPSQERNKVHFSAGVLSTFPELKNYRKKLYENTLSRIASLQNEDYGWPLSLNGRSELTSTIVVVNALALSNEEKYRERIEKGINFIIRNISNPIWF